MKKRICFLLLAIMACAAALGCNEVSDTSNYLRIHIRANDNTPAGQAVKYAVKEEVTACLTPLLAGASTKQLAMQAVESSISAIKEICDGVLKEHGFDYAARVELRKENFPMRSYNEFTFESGCYDALIIELGEGKGDNWWCMVYPPLCFVGGENDGSGRISYKSKILEIIEEFKRKYF